MGGCLALSLLTCAMGMLLSELILGAQIQRPGDGVRRAQNLGDAASLDCFPATSGVGEGSRELARGVQDCPWECKSQRQRLVPERPEGRATGFLFSFEQMVKPPDACLLDTYPRFLVTPSYPSQ